MREILEQHETDPAFLEWLSDQFDKTAVHATVEELAEFAFGDIKAAITAYKNRLRRENDLPNNNQSGY